jgi:hypothetical protein
MTFYLTYGVASGWMITLNVKKKFVIFLMDNNSKVKLSHFRLGGG